MDNVDTVSPERRSEIMGLVRGKDTRPEMMVRRIVHRMGYRFRLHRRELPGAPDLVFSRRNKVIFVHGCFWHWHIGCRRGARMPKTHASYWTSKIAANRRRDQANCRHLRALGWRVLVVWECWLRNPDKVTRQVRRFLEA
jgi:DNA mismatch endonuclease (patch repair protein)